VAVPLPSITAAEAPVVITMACPSDWWTELNGAIDQNPLLAAAVLAVAAVIAFKKKKGKA
jgi:hypothetical protein